MFPLRFRSLVDWLVPAVLRKHKTLTRDNRRTNKPTAWPSAAEHLESRQLLAATGTPGILIDNPTGDEGDTGSNQINFTVSLTNPTSEVVTVDYATALDGSATSGNDYQPTSGTLTFAPGESSKQITVNTIGDTLQEDAEEFFLDLSNATNATILDNHGDGYILNDDGGEPSLHISYVIVDEGDSGITPAVFNVTLSSPSSQTVTVNYSTVNGTASGGSDFEATTGTLTFSPGQTSQQITVNILGDTNPEAHEAFQVTLTNGVNADLIGFHGNAYIIDCDESADISIDDVTVTEGTGGSTQAVFTVSLASASSSAVSVDYTTALDGSATSGVDYAASSGTLNFAPGETSQQIVVDITTDSTDESNENFYVDLSNAVGGVIVDTYGEGTILDDDTGGGGGGGSNPSIDITDASVTEGDSGTAQAVFTVSLSASSTETVTVNFTTALDGSATSGTDYIATSGTLTFAPGATSQQIIVDVIGDTNDESNENFYVDLSNATNATIADTYGTGNIIDDDTGGGGGGGGTPSINITDATVNEGDSGTTAVVLTVSLSGASTQTVTVDFTTALDGSATSGTDYIATSGTLTFEPGATSQQIIVDVLGDTNDESNENFYVDLSNPSNATIADTYGEGDIIDDDTGGGGGGSNPSIDIDDVTVVEGTGGTNAAVFTVTLSASSTQTVTVDYTTALDGSATSGTDYTPTNGTLTFSPGQTSQQIIVPITTDAVDEANSENFFVDLSNATNATIADTYGTGNIVDDDAAGATPSIDISDASVIEGTGGTVQAIFDVTLSQPSAQPVTVDFTTALDGSATSGVDYSPNSGTLTFAPQTTFAQIVVSVISDAQEENDEVFYVDLTNPTNATIADTYGTGTIVDDDDAPTTPGISVNDISVTEGNSGTVNAVFTVSLSNAFDQPVTVDFNTANGTATAGTDYVASNGTVTFPPGTTSQSVSVPVTSDLMDENNETFSLLLLNPTNATIADSTGIATINDDDGPPTISINNATTAEGDTGTTPMVFTVSLSNPSATNVTVDYATSNDGTADSGTDFTATSGTLTFAPGVTSQQITVDVIGDTLDEADETLFIDLSNASSNASITDAEGLGTISDDDSPLGSEVFYVSSSGSDTNNGSQASPWLTLQKAADTVGPGDTVIVNAGNYAGFSIDVDGTSSDPISFLAMAGVVIDTPNPITPDGINLEGADYVIVDGFTVTGMPRAGIRSVINHHSVIRNNVTDANTRWGIYLGFSEDITIEGNTASNTINEHGIYLADDSHRATVRGNTIFGNALFGIHANGDLSSGGVGLILGGAIENNVIHGNLSAIHGDGLQNAVIQNNVIHDSEGNGIFLHQVDGADGSKNNVIANNTIVLPADGSWGVKILDGSTGNTLINNVLYSHHSFRGAISISPDSLPGLTSNNNAIEDRITLDDGNSIIDLATWQSTYGHDLNSIATTPTALAFADEAGGDFHLTAGSAAIDVGTSTSAPAVDHDGMTRPQGTAFDIGAFEFSSTGGGVTYTDVTTSNLPTSAQSSNGASMDAHFGDLDGDGDLDIVVARERQSNLLLINDGTGVFTDESNRFPTALSRDSEDVALADFDGDGDLDILIVSEDDQTNEFYLNDGSANLTDETSRIPVTGVSNASAVGDVDGDGDLDVIIGNNGQDVVLINDGSANFADETATRLPTRTDITQDVELGDIDGDGDLDIIAGIEGQNRLYANNGLGVFTDVTANLPQFSDETREADFGDVDGDGDLDLIFGNVTLFQASPNQNRLLLNNGSGVFTNAPSQLPADMDNAFDVDLEDVDNDGDKDIVAAITANLSGPGVPFKVYVNNGLGSFVADTSIFPPSVVGNGFDVVAGDVNGDGLLDFYFSSRGGSDRLALS